MLHGKKLLHLTIAYSVWIQQNGAVQLASRLFVVTSSIKNGI